MSIIISKKGRNARKIEKSSFGTEDELQRYIYDNPESLPIDEIKEEARLLILCREFPTNSGPIDALGVDQDGDIYIVETKLYRNSDKRKVIAQVLDYGAALYSHFQDYEVFMETIGDTVEDKYEMSVHEKLKDFFGLDDNSVQGVLAKLESNLLEGKFKFVVLMDQIDQRLKDMIKYLNLNSNFDIYGIEMDYFRFEDYEILIPNVFGAEVTKNVKSTRPTRSYHKWDESNFFAHAAENFTEDELACIKKIYQFTVDNADEIQWGKGEKSGSFGAIFQHVGPKPLYFVDSKEWLWWYFGWIPDEEKRRQIIGLVRDHGFEVKKDNFGIKVRKLVGSKIIEVLQQIKDFGS